MIRTCWLAAALSVVAVPAAVVAPTGGAIAQVAPSFEAAAEAARDGDIEGVRTLLSAPGMGIAERAILDAQRAAALLREQEARAALQLYFESGDNDPKRQALAHEIAAEVAFFAGRYAEAAHHAGRLLAAPTDRSARELEGIGRTLAIASLIEAVPAVELERRGTGTPIPLVRDKVGLMRIAIATGAGSEEAVVDTGAGLSVASESAAKRLGLRMLDGDAAVGNSLGSSVGVKLGIADRVEVAGAVLRNVVFVVLADEALTFPLPGGYRIDSILGLPELRALGRVRIEPGRSFAIEAPAAFDERRSNLRVIGNSPYAVLAIAGREHPFFLDTGANASSLSVRFASLHPDLATVDDGPSRRGGAGGVEEIRNRRLEQVDLRLGDVVQVVPAISVETSPTPGDEDRFGIVGADVLGLFESIVLDFEAMRLDVQPATAVPVAG